MYNSFNNPVFTLHIIFSNVINYTKNWSIQQVKSLLLPLGIQAHLSFQL